MCAAESTFRMMTALWVYRASLRKMMEIKFLKSQEVDSETRKLAVNITGGIGISLKKYIQDLKSR